MNFKSCECIVSTKITNKSSSLQSCTTDIMPNDYPNMRIITYVNMARNLYRKWRKKKSWRSASCFVYTFRFYVWINFSRRNWWAIQRIALEGGINSWFIIGPVWYSLSNCQSYQEFSMPSFEKCLLGQSQRIISRLLGNFNW